MALIKVGKYWRYDFVRGGKRFQGSTRCTNVNKARDFEAKLKSDWALGLVGLQPRKEAPLLASYMLDTFLGHVARHAKTRRTSNFYREKTKRILQFEPWKTFRLCDIDAEQIEKYAAFRLRSIAAVTVNHELATLRKALRLAEEWNLLTKAPRVRLLPGVKGRDFVVSTQLETEYLEAAVYPLRQAAILILDLGLRPEECVRLRKADIGPDDLIVWDGKSENALRALPLTSRAKQTIELLKPLYPSSEWLFPGKKGKHYTRGALDNAHTKLRSKQGWPEEFVLHGLRHTFATRLAQSGADAFVIQKALGHADIRMSQKYIHPGTEHLTLALKRKEMLDRMMRGEEAEVPVISTIIGEK